MGRAKEELIWCQENEHMIEWIEENHGLDIDYRDTKEWEAAAQDYEEYWDRKQKEEEEWQRQEELEWYIHSQTQIGIFDTQIRSVFHILEVKVYDKAQFSLFVMLHGHVVAAVEAYLASTFIHKVTNSDDLIRRLVETDPKFSKMKFTLKDIFEKQESLKFIVAQYLKELIFHDLRKIKPMFKDVLSCDFGEIGWLFKAIDVRHHCVHRAGLDKDGDKIDISKESIKELIQNSQRLVHEIENSFFERKTLDEYDFENL